MFQDKYQDISNLVKLPYIEISEWDQESLVDIRASSYASLIQFPRPQKSETTKCTIRGKEKEHLFNGTVLIPSPSPYDVAITFNEMQVGIIRKGSIIFFVSPQEFDSPQIWEDLFFPVFGIIGTALKEDAKTMGDFVTSLSTFKEMKKKQMATFISDANKDITKAKNDIKNSVDSIAGLWKKIIAHEATIKSFTDSIENADMEKAALTTLINLRKQKLLNTIVSDSSGTRVLTHEICITYEGYDYSIGKFEIIIPWVRSADIRINNLTSKKSGYDHPHISGGQPCWGEWINSVSERFALGDVVSVLVIIFEYLKSYNPGNPFKKVESWPKKITDFDKCLAENAVNLKCMSCDVEECKYRKDILTVLPLCQAHKNITTCLECSADDRVGTMCASFRESYAFAASTKLLECLAWIV